MATQPHNTEDKTRDRAKTEEAIVAAARKVLADVGFQGFGVNAIARSAGCDKQLIYRYFGGLDQLVEMIGKDVAAQLSAQLESRAVTAAPESYAALISDLLVAFVDILRADPLLQRTIAWEIADPSPLVAQFAKARGAVLSRWIEQQRGSLRPPAEIDAPATNAVLIAAVQHLVLSAAAIGEFAGLSLTNDDAWRRLYATLRRMVASSY